MTDSFDRYAGVVIFTFSDNQVVTDDLLTLMLSGKKTAACGTLRDYGRAESVSEADHRNVVLDGQSHHASAIRGRMNVKRQSFRKLDTACVTAEDDLSYDC